MDRSHRSRGSRSRRLVALFATATGGFATAARSRTAAAAAAAAAAAVVTVVMVMMATAAISTTAAAAAAAAATVTSDGHFLTAHEGDADDREEHRDA
jgi:hypothetical protein